jgi:NADPH2:quinone reductase
VTTEPRADDIDNGPQQVRRHDSTTAEMFAALAAFTYDMRAIVYSKTGDSSVLSLVERDAADPGPGEVRVRVIVSGVNPTDWKARAGGGARAASEEIVPNQDGAGVIDAIGDGVTGLEVGEHVWVYLAQHGRPTGTAQEYTVVPASRAVKLPDVTGFDIAASLGVPAMTAHRALTVHEFGPARLSPGSLDGRTVLVAGGAGAVGHAAVQLAAWAGATVIATVSSDEKAALARAAGAHHVVKYTEADAAAQITAIAPEGVDHIVEVSLAQNAALDGEVIANHGSIAYYADNGGDQATVPVRPTFAKNVRIQGLLLYTVGDAALAAAAEDITAALGDGALPVGEEAGLPLLWFPLEETAQAHDAVEQGAVGKVLIDVSGDAR